MRKMRSRIKSGSGLLCVVALAISAFGIATFAQVSAPAQPSPNVQAPAASTPSVEQILDKYLAASGGRVAWQKLNTRVSTGTVDVPAMNVAGTVEMREKAPRRILVTVTISGAVFTQGFDGTVGWSNDPQNGVREQTGPELAETRRDADFYHPLDMHVLYSKFKVLGAENVGEHLTYMMEATPADGGDPDKLYFAADTGLLVRAISQHHSPEGVDSIQEDFGDYRTVDGIQMPFSIHQTSPQMDFTIKIDEVHHNVALDDAQFSKPAAQ
jgi:hypothetical protein